MDYYLQPIEKCFRQSQSMNKVLLFIARFTRSVFWDSFQRCLALIVNGRSKSALRHAKHCSACLVSPLRSKSYCLSIVLHKMLWFRQNGLNHSRHSHTFVSKIQTVCSDGWKRTRFSHKIWRMLVKLGCKPVSEIMVALIRMNPTTKSCCASRWIWDLNCVLWMHTVLISWNGDWCSRWWMV